MVHVFSPQLPTTTPITSLRLDHFPLSPSPMMVMGQTVIAMKETAYLVHCILLPLTCSAASRPPPVTLSFISACSGGEIFVVAEVKPQICLVFLSGKGIKKKKKMQKNYILLGFLTESELLWSDWRLLLSYPGEFTCRINQLLPALQDAPHKLWIFFSGSPAAC